MKHFSNQTTKPTNLYKTPLVKREKLAKNLFAHTAHETAMFSLKIKSDVCTWENRFASPLIISWSSHSSQLKFERVSGKQAIEVKMFGNFNRGTSRGASYKQRELSEQEGRGKA